MYDLPDVSVCASLDQLLYDCCSFQLKKTTTKKATRKSSLWPVKFTALFLLEVKLRYNSWVNRSVRVATGQYVVRGRRC